MSQATAFIELVGLSNEYESYLSDSDYSPNEHIVITRIEKKEVE